MINKKVNFDYKIHVEVQRAQNHTYVEPGDPCIDCVLTMTHNKYKYIDLLIMCMCVAHTVL